MPQQSVITKNPEQDQQRQNELLGDWYNYDLKDTTRDDRQINHWLDQPDEGLRRLNW
jgi:hypothetical protein